MASSSQRRGNAPVTMKPMGALWRLLRACTPARGRGGQAEQYVAVFHSMTPWARARIDCGILRPSAIAVLKLTTSSNRVDCWIGRSAAVEAPSAGSGAALASLRSAAIAGRICADARRGLRCAGCQALVDFQRMNGRSAQAASAGAAAVPGNDILYVSLRAMTTIKETAAALISRKAGERSYRLRLIV
jgi:hypothetical protein